MTTDLFALGSSLYQVVTCHAPWAGQSHDETEARYARGEFPPLVDKGPNGTPLLFADIIRHCWHGKMATAVEVLDTLRTEIRAAFGPEDRSFIERESGISLDNA